jgi:hypothetical protein
LPNQEARRRKPDRPANTEMLTTRRLAAHPLISSFGAWERPQSSGGVNGDCNPQVHFSLVIRGNRTTSPLRGSTSAYGLNVERTSTDRPLTVFSPAAAAPRSSTSHKFCRLEQHAIQPYFRMVLGLGCPSRPYMTCGGPFRAQNPVDSLWLER